MKEEKTTQFAAKQDYLTEENLKEVAGAGPRPG